MRRLRQINVLEDRLRREPLEIAIGLLLQEGLREAGGRLVDEVGLAARGVGHLDVAGVDALVDLHRRRHLLVHLL